jgi:hypothetical protein
MYRPLRIINMCWLCAVAITPFGIGFLASLVLIPVKVGFQAGTFFIADLAKTKRRT